MQLYKKAFEFTIVIIMHIKSHILSFIMADFDEFREVVVDELEFCDKIGGGGAGLVYKVQWKGNYYAAKVLVITSLLFNIF